MNDKKYYKLKRYNSNIFYFTNNNYIIYKDLYNRLINTKKEIDNYKKSWDMFKKFNILIVLIIYYNIKNL